MKKPIVISFFVMAILALITSAAFAQNGPPPDGPRPGDQRMMPPPDGPPNDQRPPERFALMRQLGLSQDQIQQIRRMNQARKPLMDAAHDRLEEANRLLDEAIYADTVDETEIQNRTKEVQLAQAEMTKVRVMNELQVRKILTPEQLVKFRQLREKFDRMRDDFKDRNDDDRPMRQPPPQNGQPLRAPAGKPGQRPNF